jgi:hypothetical protein
MGRGSSERTTRREGTHRRKTLVTLMGAGLLVLGTAPAGAAAGVDRRPMMWHMQSGNPHGSLVGATAIAQLVRTERGISYSIGTEQLNAGHAYTVWIVVVNDPSACTVRPCPPPEILGNPDTDGQVTYGTGHVVGSGGVAGFGGSLQKGPIPQGWLPDQGLDDPMGAEIHWC